MEQTLGFFRESLSNYLEQEQANAIYRKLEQGRYQNARDFTNQLEQEDIQYLNDILRQEMNYAQNEQDRQRYEQLNQMYEQLY